MFWLRNKKNNFLVGLDGPLYISKDHRAEHLAQLVERYTGDQRVVS